jgi:protein involved in polysaccharide export with SLBB domain
MMTHRILLLLFGVLTAAVQPLAAQTRWDPTGRLLTRTQLEELLVQHEQTAASTAYSGSLRERAAEEAALVRERLEDGDFRAGDQILLEVEGQTPLSTTFTVVSGRSIVLPELGQVPLDGVLRSEVQAHLTEYISRFIRNPVVRAQTLVRIEILGAVGKPGFYTVGSDLLVTDAVMLAGGPASRSEIDEIRIQRGDEVIWDADQLRPAIIEGRTLDQLSVRAGDGIFVPQAGAGRFANVRSILTLVTGLTSVFLLGRQLGVF